MFECKALKVVWGNTGSVVLDFDGFQTLILEAYIDAGCAGVQTVLNKLLDNGA